MLPVANLTLKCRHHPAIRLFQRLWLECFMYLAKLGLTTLRVEQENSDIPLSKIFLLSLIIFWVVPGSAWEFVALCPRDHTVALIHMNIYHSNMPSNQGNLMGLWESIPGQAHARQLPYLLYYLSNPSSSLT